MDNKIYAARDLMTLDETERRITACVNAFEGIPTDRIEGKDLGEILAGEVRLHGAGPRDGGGFGFEFSGSICQLMAEAYAEQFRQSGAINYLELLFKHSDIGPLTITMQRVEGLTPAQKLAQAEAQRDSLQQKLDALTEFRSMIFGAFGVHDSHEDSVARVNIENALRRANCLSAIEHHFTFEVEDEEYEGEMMEQCPLNWGQEPEAYIETFKGVLNSVRAEGADAAAAKIRKATQAFKEIHHGAVAECADIAEMVATQLHAGKDGK